MPNTEKQAPSILADRTLVERRGEDALDRQVHRVIYHEGAVIVARDWPYVVHEIMADGAPSGVAENVVAAPESNG